MAECYDKLYSPAPDEVRTVSAAAGSSSSSSSSKATMDSSKERQEATRDFIGELVPESDRKEIDDEMKRMLLTNKLKCKQKIKKPQPVRQGKKNKAAKPLTARERRDLGLDRLPRTGGLKYADLKPLHELWKGYMAEKVDLSRTGKGVEDTAKMRLCRADYHGAHVKVTRAKCANLVGLEGFVAIETRNAFQIVGRDDVTRLVPKAGAAISFELAGRLVTLDAGNMRMKPADRAVKKWKNRQPMPL